MIKSFELQNFQSHKKSVLKFKPGVNVIIGPSDSGKTSIIRALRWIVWNRPLGDAFRSWWGGDTIGTIYLKNPDGIIAVERLQADNERRYRLIDDPVEDGLEFNAFGTDVPEEVQKALNFSEINLQEQMDSPFLLSDNPGQVSRHFNKVANIDTIDSSQRAVESWIRSINGDKKAAEKEIERHKENLQEFDYLDQLEAEIEVLEGLESRKNTKVQKCNSLRVLIHKIKDTEQKIEEKSDLIPAYSLVNHILKGMKKRSKKIKEYKQLKKLVFDIVDTREELEKSKELTYAEDPVQNILDLYKEQRTLQDEIDSLVIAIGDVEKTADYIKRSQNKLDRLEEKWHENMPEVCPLCGK